MNHRHVGLPHTIGPLAFLLFAGALHVDLDELRGRAWPVALMASFGVVALPVQALRARLTFRPGTIPLLTWGGLRGGISVALALSQPDSEVEPALLAATYAVVVFTIVVQGSTLAMVARRLVRS